MIFSKNIIGAGEERFARNHSRFSGDFCFVLEFCQINWTAFGNTNEVFDLVKTGAIVKMNLCRIYRLKSKLFQPKI